MTEKWWGQTYIKSCEDMSEIPDASVHCCVTSPPYFGLRDYGVDGQIGLESSIEEYIDRLVRVFREVRRSLCEDGTAWLIIGDSYAGSGPISQEQLPIDRMYAKVGNTLSGAQRRIGTIAGLKPKDLMGMPWRAAFALQADGWWLRDAVIWHKPNAMPSAVVDRCTASYETIFMLTKSGNYYADMDPVRTVSAPQTGLAATFKRMNSKRAVVIPGQSVGTHRPDRDDTVPNPIGSNLRNVWTIATQPYTAAHFAIFPTELAMRCIRIGCPEGGVVLDPFMGSGTTAQVAEALNRRWVGYELNPAYQQLIQDRLAQPLTFGATASKRLSQFCIYCGQRVIGPYSAHVSCEEAS